MMSPGRDPACSPKPPLTSLAWIPLPGPELAAFSVSIQRECVCSYQSPVLLSCSPICRKSQIPFNSMCPFSPCILFVYVLSVLCGAK